MVIYINYYRLWVFILKENDNVSYYIPLLFQFLANCRPSDICRSTIIEQLVVANILDIVEKIGQLYPDITISLSTGILIGAARSNNTELVYQMINRGAIRCGVALFAAIKNQNIPNIQLLIKQSTINSSTVLNRAVYTGNLSIVKLIGSHEPVPNINMALRAAAYLGDRDIFTYLLEYGKNNNILTKESYNYGLQGAIWGDHLSLIDLLLTQGDKAQKADDYNLGLMTASQKGNLPLMEKMIAGGASEFTRAGESAAGTGQLIAIKYLLSKGVTKLSGALTEAASGGHLPVVKFLVDNYVLDINSALRAAVQQGRQSVVNFLLIAGANDYSGALEKCRDEQIFRQLFPHADPGNYTKYLCRAAFFGSLPIVRLLIKAGATEITAALDKSIQHPHIQCYLKSKLGT